MSDDWQVGDLALCVNAVPVRGLPQTLTEGTVYTVIDVIWDDCPHYGYGTGLFLAEVESLTVSGFHSGRFRKVKPDQPEACEEEFRILLQLSKKRVQA